MTRTCETFPAVTYPPEIQAWQDSVNKADDRWDEYDGYIRQYVMEISHHLIMSPLTCRKIDSGQTISPPYLDWRIVKAMLWTENNPDYLPPKNPKSWAKRPLQIGNDGDPGLFDLLENEKDERKEKAKIIIPSTWQIGLTMSSAGSNWEHNLKAAIAYLMFMMVSEFKKIGVPDPSMVKAKDEKVQPRDDLGKIARRVGSTIDIIVMESKGKPMDNSKKKIFKDAKTILSIGDVVWYRKGSMKWHVEKWLPKITPELVAARYNGGGDGQLYAPKVHYAYSKLCERPASYYEASRLLRVSKKKETSGAAKGK